MLEQEELNKAMQHCPNCVSLSDCVLIIPGMVPIPPTAEENEIYSQCGGAMWKYRKCHQRLKTESEKQQSAAMNGKWQERTLKTFRVDEQNKAAYRIATEYAKRINPFLKDGLLFYGPVGTGKTHLAAGILKVAFNRGLDGVLISVPDLLNQIRKGYNGEENTIEDKVRDKFLVILDDLGAENLTDWVRERLFMLINHRYEHQKPLIITTNCTPAELTERIGVRTTDRIREMCKTVQINGKSKRGQNNGK
jgi:DNA replication protein DnaC